MGHKEINEFIELIAKLNNLTYSESIALLKLVIEFSYNYENFTIGRTNDKIYKAMLSIPEDLKFNFLVFYYVSDEILDDLLKQKSE
jgi:hypothetical protein